MRILLVDDNNDIVRLVSQVLEIEGHNVVVARDGLEAMQHFGTARPDAVVLDVNLPVIEGWEVCRRIKSHDSSIPVMMLTVRAERVDLEKGRAVGANAYLAKPFDIPEFLRNLKAMLAKAYGEPEYQRSFDPASQFVNANGSTVWEAFGRVATSTNAMSVARIAMPPGLEQQQRSNRFDEVLIVISGSCTVVMDGKPYDLTPNSVLRIPANTPYREQVKGENACIAWAICTPAYSVDLVDYAQPEPPSADPTATE